MREGLFVLSVFIIENLFGSIPRIIPFLPGRFRGIPRIMPFYLPIDFARLICFQHRDILLI